MAIDEISVCRLAQPDKNMCVAATSTSSRSVWRITLMTELYPRRCWLSGPVKPIGRWCRTPRPATRDTNMLEFLSFAMSLLVVGIPVSIDSLTAATHRCAIVCRKHVDVGSQETHAEQLNCKHGCLFMLWLALETGDNDSKDFAPLSQVVCLLVHILA